MSYPWRFVESYEGVGLEEGVRSVPVAEFPPDDVLPGERIAMLIERDVPLTWVFVYEPGEPDGVRGGHYVPTADGDVSPNIVTWGKGAPDSSAFCALCGHETSLAMLAKHLEGHGIDMSEIADAPIIDETEDD